MPPLCVAAGAPARVVRRLTPCEAAGLCVPPEEGLREAVDVGHAANVQGEPAHGGDEAPARDDMAGE